MIRSLWTAKTGLESMQFNIDVISNNLSNVNTTGFKKSRPIFSDLIYQTLRQPGIASSQSTQLPTGLELGTGVRPIATERIQAQGNLQQTGDPYSIAINGPGFFQIQLPDGQTGYTRAGDFRVNEQGVVTTAEGYPLLGNLTVPQEARQFNVTPDGEVTVLLPDQVQETIIGNIQLASFINPAGLEARGENLLLQSQASGAPQAGTPGLNGVGRLQQTYVEASNVNPTEELVNMIQAQRAFEMNSRAVQTTDQMLQRLGQL